MAKKAGEAWLADVKGNPPTNGFGAPKLVSRTASAGLDEAAFATVMKADVTKLPAQFGTPPHSATLVGQLVAGVHQRADDREGRPLLGDRCQVHPQVGRALGGGRT